MKLKYEIKEKDIDKSINNILTNELNISTRLLTKLIKNEKISIHNHKYIFCHQYSIRLCIFHRQCSDRQ